MNKGDKLYRIFIYIVLILFALSIIIPVGWVFLASLKENTEFYQNPWSLPAGLYFENFARAWREAHMGEYFLNSVIVTAMALGILLIVALPAAYVLARYRFGGRRLIRTLFMGGLFINVSYIVVPIFLMLVGAGNLIGSPIFLNNRFVLALVYASTALPFTIYLLSSYFQTLPKEYEEAAYVDGSGYMQTMIRVMIPMARPSVITVILFNFLSFWNEYIIALTLMTQDRAKTLPVGLMNLMKAQNAAAQYGQMYAGLVMVMLPTLILYILVQKKLTQGMNVGGLKD